MTFSVGGKIFATCKRAAFVKFINLSGLLLTAFYYCGMSLNNGEEMWFVLLFILSKNRIRLGINILLKCLNRRNDYGSIVLAIW